MRSVLLLGISQIVSLLGVGMVNFAMTLWVWQSTERATPVALIWFFVAAPAILVSPVAGALVDRWRRKSILIGAGSLAGVVALGLLVLLTTGALEIWHLYVAGAVASLAGSLQAPAQMASVTLMVPKEHLARANGIMSIAQFGSMVLSPALAGLLAPLVEFRGILVIDVAMALIAATVVACLQIPQPPARVAKRSALWRDTLEGFRYILERRPIVHVILVFTAVNVLFGLFDGTLKPMVLARTGQDSHTLALVLAAQGIGGISGGLLLSLWRGRQRHIHGVLLGSLGISFGLVLVGFGKTSLVLWACGAFCATLTIPVMSGSVLSIGQAKIAPELQGRVFGILRMVAQATYPLALASAGPLADYVFEPAMRAGGPLAALLGPLFGTGPGAGMSVMMVPCALVGFLLSIVGYATPTIRDVETILPDLVPRGPAG